VIFTQWRDGPLVQGQKGARMRISTNYEINLRDMQLRRSDCKTVTAVKAFWSNDDQLEFNFQEELDRRANAPADRGFWKSKPLTSVQIHNIYNDCSAMTRIQDCSCCSCSNLKLMRVQRQERQAAQAAAAAEGTAAAEKFLSECEEPGVKKARRD